MNKSDSPAAKSARQRSKSAVVTAFEASRRRVAGQSVASDTQVDDAPRKVSSETLRELQETIDQLPEINATRVVQLHQRIMAGEYVVDLERLTDKLLALEAQIEADTPKR